MTKSRMSPKVDVYLSKTVTNSNDADEPFSSQPGGPMVLWPIFRVARFSRTNLSMIVARALKIGQIADGGMPPTYETMR